MTVSTARRLWAFTWEMAPPRVYLTYAVVCVLGLRAALAMGSGVGRLTLSWATVVEILTIWAFLFYIRGVDEQKDLEHDRVHNPERPLVRGSVTVRDLRIGLAIAVVVVVGINAWRWWLLPALVVAELGYILFLVALERLSPRVREGIFGNLLVTYPVQLLMGAYLLASWSRDARVPIGWGAVPAAGVFVCVFLHFEVARKTSWTRRRGDKLYSSVLGPRGSGTLALALGVAAIVLALVAAAPAWPGGLRATAVLAVAVPAGFLLWGAWRFARGDRPAWPRGAAMGVVATQYLAVLAVGAAFLG